MWGYANFENGVFQISLKSVKILRSFKIKLYSLWLHAASGKKLQLECEDLKLGETLRDCTLHLF